MEDNKKLFGNVILNKIFTIIAASTEDDDASVVRTKICDELLEDLGHLKGNELESCLSDVSFNKAEQHVRIVLEFRTII